MSNNDEDLLPGNYQKYKKSMLDGVKKKRNYLLTRLK